MGLKYLIFLLVLFILIPINKSENVSANYLQTKDIEQVVEVKEELIETEEQIEIPEKLPKETSTEEINKRDEHNIEENKEEIEIKKFKVDGLMLREGIVSEEVLRLKKFFKVKGYTDMAEDYYFDKLTKEIVIKYQKENDLVPDGIVGKNTFTKINQDMELNNIVILEKQLIFSVEIPEENFIIINKDSNTLYHLKNRQIVNKYPIATGKDPRYTPEGKFTIVTKFINPAWGGAGRHKPIKGGAPNNPLGKRWMGLNIRGGGVYGIHGNSDKGSIGRYVSLGCVRMFNEDVEILFDIIDYKTPVWIGTEERLKEYGVIFDYNDITVLGSDME